MPRYYFHLTDGTQVLKVPEGLDLLGNAAARDEALRFARDLKDGKTMPDRDWTGWFVSVVDGHGKEVDRIPIGLVPDAPNPPVS
jgi:hypothetical protein